MGIGLVSLTGMTLFGAAAGCTAEGSDETVTDPTPVEPEPKDPEHKDPEPTPISNSSSSSSTSSSSSGSMPTKDAAADGAATKPDAKADSGPVGPVVPSAGDTCTAAGTLFEKKCGFCGRQEAVCETDNTVSEYGFCHDEVAGGCEPGKIEDVACGRCGTMKQVCQADCSPAVGSCIEPAGACWPGAVKWTSAGCSFANTFRKQTCEDTCTFGAPSALPCTAKDTWSLIAGPGGQVDVDGTLSSTSDVVGRLDTGTCPVTINSSKTTYGFTEIRNGFAKAATVEIRYDSAVGSIDTVTAAYIGAKKPDVAKEAERKACTGKVNDICSEGSSWSCLIGTDAVKIPAGGTLWVYTANYYAGSTGPFRVQVKTVSLDP